MMETLRALDEGLHTCLGPHTLYLYGSAAVGDFRLGWSDIDFLCLSDAPMTSPQCALLGSLLGFLAHRRPANPYWALLEGAALHAEAFLHGTSTPTGYWGSHGFRQTSGYVLDPFGRQSLLENGIRISGPELRGNMAPPQREELVQAVARHCQTVLRHGTQPSRSLYAAGWMLDTARCLYTLRTGKLLPKTAAGYWALQEGLCPSPDVLRQILRIRENPRHFAGACTPAAFWESLPPHIEAFARVLEHELEAG